MAQKRNPSDIPTRTVTKDNGKHPKSYFVSDELYDAMLRHPEVNWSEVCRRAVSNTIEELESQ